MTRRFPLFLCALALVLSLCGCWAEEPDDDGSFWDDELPPAESGSAEPSAVPITAFALPYLAGGSFDPVTCPDGMQQTLVSLLYEGLFTLDPSFTPQQVLCSRYEVNDEKTTYTFYLQENVCFSDGSPLTAGDVLATLRRAAQSERYGARFANVSSMRVANGALVISLTRADSAFPALLDIPIVKSGSEKSSVPLGTGPYLFVTEGDGAFLKRSEEWWQGKALPLERIELCAVKDTDTASYLFSSREVHLLATDLTGGQAELRTAGTSITDYATANMIYLGFNTQRALLSDETLRSAIAGAIDRETVAVGYLAGHASAARFPISPNASVYPDELATTLASPDLSAALDSAGITAERPRTLSILVCERDTFKVSIAEYLARTLSTDALSVTVRALSWTDYLTALENGSFDLYLGEVRLTANWDISALVRTGGSLNYGRYSDAQCEALLDTFLASGTAQSAKAFCRYLAQSAPIAPIAFRSSSVLMPEGLADGLAPSASSPFYCFEAWQFHFDSSEEQ